MQATLGRNRFGLWTLITRGSSGIGREFARQAAFSGINVFLVARREGLLKQVTAEPSQRFGVEHCVIGLGPFARDHLSRNCRGDKDVDIGMVISNAGGASPGRFTNREPKELAMTLRLRARMRAELALHFARRLMERGSDGMLFAGAMGADIRC
jgi:uncharacterized protein